MLAAFKKGCCHTSTDVTAGILSLTADGKNCDIGDLRKQLKHSRAAELCGYNVKTERLEKLFLIVSVI